MADNPHNYNYEMRTNTSDRLIFYIIHSVWCLKALRDVIYLNRMMINSHLLDEQEKEAAIQRINIAAECETDFLKDTREKMKALRSN